MTADTPIKSSAQIAHQITDAMLSQKLAPGTRLGEQQLAELFGVSRTQIREALTRLVTRGIVTVSPRRGWYVIAPTPEDAREAFEARRVLELGLLRHARPITVEAIQRLRQHVEREQAAIDGDDVAARSYLLGDFHVCLCESFGNTLLADTLRDFTTRTTLTAMLYQSSHHARQSCAEHGGIVAALENSDLALAEELMNTHLCNVEAGLSQSARTDPLSPLQRALTLPPLRAIATSLSTAVPHPQLKES